MSNYKLNEEQLTKLKDTIEAITNSNNIEISCDDKIGTLSKGNVLITPLYIYTVKIEDFEKKITFKDEQDINSIILSEAETLGYAYLISRRN